MRVLVLGGTGFIGPHVIRRLVAEGHEVSVFHRGHTTSDLPDAVGQARGEYRDLPSHAIEFRRLAPDVVLDIPRRLSPGVPAVCAGATRSGR